MSMTMSLPQRLPDELILYILDLAAEEIRQWGHYLSPWCYGKRQPLKLGWSKPYISWINNMGLQEHRDWLINAMLLKRGYTERLKSTLFRHMDLIFDTPSCWDIPVTPFVAFSIYFAFARSASKRYVQDLAILGGDDWPEQHSSEAWDEKLAHLVLDMPCLSKLVITQCYIQDWALLRHALCTRLTSLVMDSSGAYQEQTLPIDFLKPLRELKDLSLRYLSIVDVQLAPTLQLRKLCLDSCTPALPLVLAVLQVCHGSLEDLSIQTGDLNDDRAIGEWIRSIETVLKTPNRVLKSLRLQPVTHLPYVEDGSPTGLLEDVLRLFPGLETLEAPVLWASLTTLVDVGCIFAETSLHTLWFSTDDRILFSVWQRSIRHTALRNVVRLAISIRTVVRSTDGRAFCDYHSRRIRFDAFLLRLAKDLEESDGRQRDWTVCSYASIDPCPHHYDDCDYCMDHLSSDSMSWLFNAEGTDSEEAGSVRDGSTGSDALPNESDDCDSQDEPVQSDDDTDEEDPNMISDDSVDAELYGFTPSDDDPVFGTKHEGEYGHVPSFSPATEACSSDTDDHAVDFWNIGPEEEADDCCADTKDCEEYEAL